MPRVYHLLLHFVHTLYVYVSYDSHSKHQIYFPKQRYPFVISSGNAGFLTSDKRNLCLEGLMNIV
jgi:hypothetical protein